MSTYGIDMGHTLSGAGTGAVGVAKETDKNREVGKRLIAMLKEKGHTAVNCTVDKSNNDLADRVRLANAQRLDLFISIHLNAFNGSADGIETYIYNGSYSGKESNRSMAKRINDEVAQSVGFRNRGVKENNFYVLRETVAPAVLIELGFCDSKIDMNKWNTEKIAAAMFKGITGTSYVSSTPSQPTTSNKGFRVVCGTYSNRENAVAQQNKLKTAGFDSFLVAVDL
ncbi:MAG: N-acetylmuramoyl-L-alanine amidase [Clostridium sp.]